MKKLLLLSVFAGMMLTLSGCGNNECSDSQPFPAPRLRFYLSDESGENLVTDSNSIFHPDSVQLWLRGNQLVLSKEYDAALKGYVFENENYNDYLNGEDLRFILYLSEQDMDTLDVTYRITKKCGESIEFSTFFFNQERIYPDIPKGGLLKLEKQ